ncbi:hypothetical protein [Chryseolinea sp. H1M3-3]|uniref:hypothetical protein n=1 Tax=Chryseolinea sp. H1M3-3 TaxID=3034144 RepID=UPI0023EC884C|nr:hypothetical protein [Chryseolinea sp. H1M3-3]
MKAALLFTGLVFLSSVMVMAQAPNQSENLVQYDPLFWKEKLKLDDEQCQKIKEINGEYYQSLFTAYQKEKHDHEALRSMANKSLIQRNQEIWETFHPKQRKRWKRMWETQESTNES